MRGKPNTDMDIWDECWITPAGAGKTRKEKTAAFEKQDHPRRCGENRRRLICTKLDVGSPPQVRGKPPQSRFSLPCCGITPAGAGKTGGFAAVPAPTTDHPRRCGENRKPEPHNPGTKGSPPQVRGKHMQLYLAGAEVRITPAGAGKTCLHFVHLGSKEDHPRRCGENY